MKKLLLAALLYGTSLQAQSDSTVQVTMSLNQFRALLATIDANIDSKRASKELIEFLQQNARLVQPTTDWNKKAKDAAKEIENKPKQ